MVRGETPGGLYHYRVFGLAVLSERPIAGLAQCAEVTTPDVLVRFGRGPAAPLPASDWSSDPFYKSPFEDESGRPLGVAWEIDDGAYLRVLLSDGAEFVVDRCGIQVWVNAPATSDSTVGEYLIGPVFGITLGRRDIVSLHASVVGFENVAVAFLGPEGSGKSTLAALFAMRGHAVVTDDLAALVDLGNAMLVQPGAPYLRARPGAIEKAADALGRRGDVAPSPDRGYLDLDLLQAGYRAAQAALPLGAIYVLDAAKSSAADAGMEPLVGAEAVITLLGNTWATRLLDRGRRSSELDLLTRVASHVPMKRIRVRRDEERVAALADDIERDLISGL